MAITQLGSDQTCIQKSEIGAFDLWFGEVKPLWQTGQNEAASGLGGVAVRLAVIPGASNLVEYLRADITVVVRCGFALWHHDAVQPA